MLSDSHVQSPCVRPRVAAAMEAAAKKAAAIAAGVRARAALVAMKAAAKGRRRCGGGGDADGRGASGTRGWRWRRRQLPIAAPAPRTHPAIDGGPSASNELKNARCGPADPPNSVPMHDVHPPDIIRASVRARASAGEP